MTRIDHAVRTPRAIVGVLLGLWLLTKLWSVLRLASEGLRCAASLLPYVGWLQQRTHNRALAVLAVLGTVVAVFATARPESVTAEADVAPVDEVFAPNEDGARPAGAVRADAAVAPVAAAGGERWRTVIQAHEGARTATPVLRSLRWLPLTTPWTARGATV
jgi:hypothetical protein